MLLFMHILVYIEMNATDQLMMLVSLIGALYCFLIGDPMGNSPEVKRGNSLRISTKCSFKFNVDTVFSYMLVPY